MIPPDAIEFRRCPRCSRVEVAETGEALAVGNDHDRCDLPVEHWVHFRAPPDWRPAEG